MIVNITLIISGQYGKFKRGLEKINCLKKQSYFSKKLKFALVEKIVIYMLCLALKERGGCFYNLTIIKHLL
jgi:hypothetical protein